MEPSSPSDSDSAGYERRSSTSDFCDDGEKCNSSLSGASGRSFTLSELEVATKNFRESNLLGGGGFGKVYKGYIRCSLDWNTRMKIAIGAARGRVSPLCAEASCDVPGSKICEHITFRLGACQIWTGWRQKPCLDQGNGSSWMLGPRLCDERQADIFSFGVVLLELITGRKAYGVNKTPGEQSLVDWSRPFMKERRRSSEMVDPRLRGRFSARTARHMIFLTGLCLKEEPSLRPS